MPIVLPLRTTDVEILLDQGSTNFLRKWLEGTGK